MFILILILMSIILIGDCRCPWNDKSKCDFFEGASCEIWDCSNVDPKYIKKTDSGKTYVSFKPEPLTFWEHISVIFFGLPTLIGIVYFCGKSNENSLRNELQSYGYDDLDYCEMVKIKDIIRKLEKKYDVKTNDLNKLKSEMNVDIIIHSKNYINMNGWTFKEILKYMINNEMINIDIL